MPVLLCGLDQDVFYSVLQMGPTRIQEARLTWQILAELKISPSLMLAFLLISPPRAFPLSVGSSFN